MAAPNDSKLLVYGKLFALNRAFVHAERNLNFLLAVGVLREEITRVWQNRLRDIQSEVNQELTTTLRDREYKDARRPEQPEEFKTQRKKTKR
jgi:hypothetical protein